MVTDLRIRIGIKPEDMDTPCVELYILSPARLADNPYTAHVLLQPVLFHYSCSGSVYSAADQHEVYEPDKPGIGALPVFFL